MSCKGAYNVLRVSELKPGATVDQFMKAVTAHQAWYTSHGFPDVIFAARVVLTDPKTQAETWSDTQIVTYHYSKGAVPVSSHDAAWDAYVKMYNDISTIKQTTLNCVPAAGIPPSMK
jgi:hypothetical protein